MIAEYMNMDTQEKVRYVSESSNTSTSCSTPTNDGGGGSRNPSSNSPSSVFSMSSSPSQSPRTQALQAEFSNMGMSSAHSPQYGIPSVANNYNHYQNFGIPQHAASVIAPDMHMQFMQLPISQPDQQQQQQMRLPQHEHQNFIGIYDSIQSNGGICMPKIKQEFTASLRILEQPVEKFRFRYKSEMHGTHGSLNGANSKRSPKTYPEVELCNYNGPAIIRCSLFQKNLDSPHSHQLVVRKDDADICDPHDVHVSPQSGFVAQFQNMGIIHTAKKFIFEELLKKKENRLKFELGCNDLSTKQIQELHKETEKEAKDMNLNQVRLCFEAFKVEPNHTWTRIAAPVYSNPINNRKAAQTGELRICRLSIATGTVTGGDDLILLVEKVSKKNIKVRFYELNEDDGLVWEAFARFRESDVHHQYAIVCQTPAYKDKDIDKPVEVNIELVRPSDDERSYPPITFRYKPRDAVISRKRRRTTTSSSGSGSNSSSSSLELPTPIQDQNSTGTLKAQPTNLQQRVAQQAGGMTISEEYNKSMELQKLCDSEEFRKMLTDSAELERLCDQDFLSPDILSSDNLHNGRLETDGVSVAKPAAGTSSSKSSSSVVTQLDRFLQTSNDTNVNDHLKRIFKIFDERKNQVLSEVALANAAKEMSDIYIDHSEKNDNNDSIIHEIIAANDAKVAIKLCHIIEVFKLNQLLNRTLNAANESGLHYASLLGRPHFIRPLCGLGCDPNIQDRKGNTALHVALQDEQYSCVESYTNIPNIPLNLTLRNDEGMTPVHLAIRQNKIDLTRKILQTDSTSKGILTGTSKDGNTALHMAIAQQNLKMVEMIFEFVDKGIVQLKDLLCARNAAGQTAMDLAKSLHDDEDNKILSYLLKYNTENGNFYGFIKTEEENTSSSTDEDDRDERAVLELAAIKDDDESDYSNDSHKLIISTDSIEGMEEESCHDEKFSNTSNSSKNTKHLSEFDRNKNVMVAIKTHNLSEILRDSKKSAKLVKILNEDDKWKLLATKLKIQHLLFLWTSVEDLLQYLNEKGQHIDYDLFLTALYDVDEDAFEIFKIT